VKSNREIATAIDLRVRQLAVRRLSDSALADQMVGYMGDLQQLWTSTTDRELAALCAEFPGFVRYATLMENVSEALRSGEGVPASLKQLAPLPERVKRVVEQLLSEGVALERAWQQRIDAARAVRFRTKTTQGLRSETADLDARRALWCAAAEQLVAGLSSSNVSDQAQQLVTDAFQDLTRRIEQLRTNE
jgi:hypothetical protein